jgi:magnesium chelatase family protein
MDIPCPVKDNHQHGSCRLAEGGSAYDLTIGILVASEQIKADIDKYIIMGELSLDGSLQPIRGALPIAIKLKRKGLKAFSSKAK